MTAMATQLKKRIALFGRKKVPQYQCPTCERWHFETDENPYCDSECKKGNDEKFLDDGFDGVVQKIHPRTERKHRRPLTPKQRERIFERDGYQCNYCLRNLHSDGIHELVIDHFAPYSYFPNEEFPNLLTSCIACNQAKSNMMFKTIQEVQEFLWETNKKYRQYTKIRRSYLDTLS
jgi:hypothetical protein